MFKRTFQIIVKSVEWNNGQKAGYPAGTYSGYDELSRKADIMEVGYRAHARRKLDAALSSRPGEAADILSHIARLYHEVETLCASMTPAGQQGHHPGNMRCQSLTGCSRKPKK